MFLEAGGASRPDWTAPAYVTRDAFRSARCEVVSGPVSLPGTLSMPAGDGPFPGVVLVHGSGPQDRDETIGGFRPFQDLAQGLASRGIAVLRYDKRTKVYQKELAGTRDLTIRQEVIDDALAAVKLLRADAGSRPEARLPRRPQSRGDPRAADRRPRWLSGGGRAARGAFTAHVGGGSRPGAIASRAGSDRSPAAVGARHSEGSERARRHLCGPARPAFRHDPGRLGVVLARPEVPASARGRPFPRQAASRPAGRTRLSGLDGRLLRVEEGARRPPGRRPQVVSRP